MDSASESLIERAAARLSQPPRAKAVRRAGLIGWRFAIALAAMIALGPLTTIVGAGVLERDARADAARLRTAAAPRAAADVRETAARGLLRQTVRDAPVALWLDRAARILPADARLSRMAKAADGAIEIDITAADPDLVRGALRRDAAFAGFRETGQRRAGAMILITYRRAA